MCIAVLLLLLLETFIGMKSDIESEERGSQRNSADLRIKKAQVQCVL